ncbi:hypothetical protein AGOR_G00217260 [Albula goreensis]|uniref:Ig-like domain-containing protein n=1 Tax=Albula goreensis TaxID=1534307 RepID=A0A8T3CJ77_9TELE|nr:hypothetical protein AGOR_G00217260 [Albula goreensis]
MERTTRMVGLVLFLLGIPGNTCEVVYGLAGGEITLSPDATFIQRILWKYHDNKLAEWETGDLKPEIYQAYNNFTILDTTSGILTFKPLSEDNQTIYSVEINGKATSKQYKLHLLDALTKPAVTCENINSSTVTLRCAGDQSPLTQYSWVGPEIQNKPGSELQLSDEDIQSSDAVYTCVVQNPVSNRSEDFDAKTCLPAQGNSGIIVGVISFLIIALIAVVPCFIPPVRKRLQRFCAQRKHKVKEVNISLEEDALLPSSPNTGDNDNITKNGEGGTSDDKGAIGNEEASIKQQEEETVNASPDKSQPLKDPPSTLVNGVTVDVHEQHPVQESGDNETIGENGEGGTSDDKGASGNEEPSIKEQEETGDNDNVTKNGEGGTSDDKGASGNEEPSIKQQEETADSKDDDKNEESRDPDNVSPQHESNDETSFDQQDSEKENQAGNLEGEEHENAQGAEAAETSESKDEGGNSEPSDLAEASAQAESDGKKDEPSNEEDHAGNRDTGVTEGSVDSAGH